VVGLLLIVALGCAAEFATFARSDMAFLLYAAERVVDGARLYVDVVEINPPLIIAWNIPPVLIARALGLSDIAVLRAWDSLALVASLAFSVWSLRLALGPDRPRPIGLLLAVVLFLAPGNDFGQREHLLVALVMPYVLLAVTRIEGRPAPAGPALAAGILAGAGLALKPHFLLVWVAVEGYAAWRTRTRRPSVEALGALGFLALYVAAVALVVPEFFRMALLLGPAYNRFGHYSFLTVLVTAPGSPECFLAVLTCLALYRKARHPAFWVVVLVGLLASYLAGAAQLKAWTYHFFPPRVFALLLLGLAVLDVRRPFHRPVQRLYGAVALGVLGTSLVWAFAMGALRVVHRDPTRESEHARLDQYVAAIQRYVRLGGGLFTFSYTINSSFPLVNYSGVRWASRFPHLWILEAAYQDGLHGAQPLRYRTREEMGPAERYVNDAVAEDLARYRPDLLMVLRNARDVQGNALRRLDYLQYFGRDPRIAAELRHYRLAEEVGQYRLYVRAASADAPGMLPAAEPGERDVLRSPVSGWRAVISDTQLILRVLVFLVLASLAYAADRRRAQSESGAGSGH